MSKKLISACKEWIEKAKSNDLKYQHPPLSNKRSFRLLKILRGNQPEVRFTLKTFSIDNPPKYQAISYTWGRATCGEFSDGTEQFDDPLCNAICNGHTVSIMENLNDALLEFRRSKVFGYLWVDAVCIKQDDVLERQSQVSQMGDIYANAYEVVVWLGKDETDLDDLIKTHEVYYPRISAEWTKAQAAGRTPDIRTLGIPESLNVNSEEWGRVWQAYVRFYRTRRWFRRGWVLQELALAKRLVVRSGRKILNWAVILDLDDILHGTLWDEQLGIGEKDIDHTIDLSRLGRYRQTTLRLSVNFNSAEPDPLLWVRAIDEGLERLRHKEVTLPHDKIYAVLGIVNKYLPIGMEPPIRVDYSLSLSSLFSDISEFLMIKVPNLDFFERINNNPPRLVEGLPSWSSDFRPGHLSNRLQFYPAREGLRYNFSGELQYSQQAPQRIGNRMTFNGNCVDKCHSMAKKTVSGGLSRVVAEFVKELLIFCQKLDPKYSQTGEDRLDVLWRSLIGNKTIAIGSSNRGYFYPAGAETADAFSQWLILMLASEIHLDEEADWNSDEEREWNEIVESFQDGSTKLPSFQDRVNAKKNTKAGILSPAVNEGEEYGIEIRFMLAGHRLFLTQNGYIGVGVNWMEIGDEIWLFETGNLGYILRPVPGDTTYSFVGTAYLHGFMNGEALDLPGFREGIRPVHVV